MVAKSYIIAKTLIGIHLVYCLICIVLPCRETIVDLQKLIDDLRRRGEQNGANQEELVREIYMYIQLYVLKLYTYNFKTIQLS